MDLDQRTAAFDHFLLGEPEPMRSRMRAALLAFSADIDRALEVLTPHIDAALRELRELLAPSLRDLFDDAFEPLPLFGSSRFTGALACAGKLPAPPELRGDRSLRALPSLHARAPRSSWETARRAFCCDRERAARSSRERRG